MPLKAPTVEAPTSPRRTRSPAYSLWRRQGPWKDALRRRMLAAADIVAVLGAALAGGLMEQDRAAALWCAGLLPLWLFIANAQGLYHLDHSRIRHSTVDELPTLLHWVTLSLAVTAVVLELASDVSLSASSAAVMWGVALPLAVVARVGTRALWRSLVPPERGLVLGSGELAASLVRKLALEPGHHLSLAASVDLEQASAQNGQAPSANGSDLEQLSSLDELIAREGIERVVIATHDLDEAAISHVVAACRATGVKLSVAPPLRAMFGTAVNLNHLAELPLIEFKTWDPSRSTMALKRLVDLIGGGLALILMLPFMGLIAAVIRLDSPGPALFVQWRAGRGGRPFRMLKFRTMVEDAPERLAELIDIESLGDPMYKLRGDPRVTRVGRLLRTFSLDELPQLFNVVRGDMSLVGPRPEETWLVERYGDGQRFRLEMRPGLTGPMQVHGRGELTFQERLAVEREYVENYSLQKDLRILLGTLGAVIWRRGAF